ncbi:LPS-assembly lipoprotein RlpB [Legionella massiliensis]|uniref:LPS-assembly lipoprotein LptE n=1 Tax=Legionella massiliensis TaxID=1034943 RepID=A0A078KV96_9GAMM|nr:LPS assembly lipoprotein LptE [Legionella massiliensis]CDZ78365.1 LPS-assembly lipoprotein RlpB [Legionella massiliensis]CEE14103.1 LPS-assembly lipoprotein LptE [Legionella massiliensis]
MIRKLLLLGLITLLASCGFHLRGFNDMPRWLNNISIVIENAHRDLGPIIKDQLEAYKIQVNPAPARADYILVIESDGIQQQITNIAASTAPRQYLLIYVVQFKLIKVKGGVIIPPTSVSVTRQLTVNNDRILGSNSEETLLSKEMRNDAAMQIMNRLSRENKSLSAAS